MGTVKCTEMDDEDEITYTVPSACLSDLLRVVMVGMKHPQKPWLTARRFRWSPAGSNRDHVTVVFVR